MGSSLNWARFQVPQFYGTLIKRTPKGTLILRTTQAGQMRLDIASGDIGALSIGTGLLEGILERGLAIATVGLWAITPL